MRSRWILALLVIGLGMPAFAAEPAYYPATLIDVDCEDDDASGGTTLVVGKRVVQTQNAGNADGKCDKDDEILTGAFTADAVLGPFRSEGNEFLYIHANSTAVSGGTGTWGFCVATAPSHEPPADIPPAADSLRIITCSQATGVVDGIHHVGTAGLALSFQGAAASSTFNVGTTKIPNEFYLILDLAGGVGHSTAAQATSWAGSASLVWAK